MAPISPHTPTVSDGPRSGTTCTTPALESPLLNVQSTHNKQPENAKESLNFKYLLSLLLSGLVLSAPCRWRHLSPVCLLMEILIEISERDFNHRSVARAYLCEPQRRCQPPRIARQPPSARLKTPRLPVQAVRRLPKSQRNLTAAENKQNEEALAK